MAFGFIGQVIQDRTGLVLPMIWTLIYLGLTPTPADDLDFNLIGVGVRV